GGGRVNPMGDNSGSGFTGETEIHQGSLAIGIDANLGVVPDDFVSDQLSFKYNDWGYLFFTNTFTLNVKRGIYLERNANLSVNASCTGTYAGIISEDATARAVAKVGPGDLVLLGTNTFTGNLYVENGTVEVGGANPLKVPYLDVGPVSGDDPARLFAKDGAVITNAIHFRKGDVWLENTLGMREAGSSLLSGEIEVSEYMVVTNAATSTQVVSKIWQSANDLGFRKTGSGVLVLYTNHVNHITNEVGTLRAASEGGWFNWSHMNLLSGAVFDLAGNTVTQGCVDGVGNVSMGAGNLVVDGGWNGTLSGVIGGSGGVTKMGGDPWTLGGNNTFEGGLNVYGGTLQLQTHTNAMGAGAVNVTNATLDLNYGAATLRPVTLTLLNGDVTKSVSGSTTWRGDMVSYHSSTATISSGNFYIYGGLNIASGTLVFNNASESGMSGGTMTGAGQLTKQGAGAFRLRPGTHSGNITLSGGEIKQYTGAMTPGGTLIMENGSTYRSDGTTARTMTKASQINGNVTLGHSGGGAMTFSGAMSLNSDTRTLTMANTNIISGVISAGGLTKAGDGLLILSGANDYALDTTISAGTLQIGNAGASGDVAGNIVNNAKLAFDRTDTALDYDDVISGTGWVEQQGSGTVTLSGANEYSGGTLVSAGTLKGTTTSLKGYITNNAAVAFDQAGDGTYSGVLSGTGTLAKQGAGEVTLSGANTYSGAGTIEAGTLKITHNTALGTAVGSTVSDGATLAVQGGITSAEALSMRGTGDGGAGAINSISGDNTLSGGITLTSAGEVQVDADSLTLGGVVNSEGVGRNLTKTGAGTLVLGGANTFAGQLNIEEGVVSVASVSATRDAAQPLGAATQTRDIYLGSANNKGVLRYTGATGESAKYYGIVNSSTGEIDVVESDTTLTISGVIRDGGTTATLIKSGAGTAVFSSSANNYGGLTVVEEGVLRAVDANSLGSGGASDNHASRIVSGASLELQGGFTIAERMYLNGTGIASDGALRSVSGAQTNSQDIYMESAASIGVDADSLTLTDTIQGSANLTKVGAGMLMLTAINTTFTGKDIVNAGTLGFQSGETRLGATPAEYVADQITLNGGTLHLNGASNQELSDTRGITLGASGGGLSADSDRTLTINPLIVGSAGGGLTKSGAGTVVLNADNTYDGDTTVSAGILRIGASDRVPNTSALSVGASGTFDLANNNETVGSLAGAGSVTLGSGTLTAGGLGTSTEYEGVMSGSGNFTKTGAGTLTLSGDNSYEGDTTVSVGTLALGAADRIDDLSDLIVASGATFAMSNHNEDINSISGVAGSTIAMGAGDLRISGVWTTEFAGVISGEGGQLIHEGTGAGGDEGDLTLSGINTYSGGTVISGGLIRVSADANLGAATGDIWLGAWKSLDFMDSFSVNAGRTLVLCDDDGGHLTVEGGETVEFQGDITGAGQLNKNGAGQLNLYAESDYS
ncbi:MAG: autotransporter-associated beta strand repeat-containing protein, partial [Kiritimatiellae bacterium]|nr:autotransporter-associated beta strand repeat-containing protein [Kiritimatiellia bacterium]